jgi:hypothetical protein
MAADRVLAVARRLLSIYGDEVAIPSPWLRRRGQRLVKEVRGGLASGTGAGASAGRSCRRVEVAAPRSSAATRVGSRMSREQPRTACPRSLSGSHPSCPGSGRCELIEGRARAAAGELPRLVGRARVVAYTVVLTRAADSASSSAGPGFGSLTVTTPRGAFFWLRMTVARPVGPRRAARSASVRRWAAVARARTARHAAGRVGSRRRRVAPVATALVRSVPGA